MRNEEQSSRLLYDICALLFTAIPSPRVAITGVAWGRLPPLSPWSLASLMWGISLTMMLSGSVTFLIGCVMMPLVFGMVMLLFFVGLLSSISVLWKVVLGLAFSSHLLQGAKNFSK